MAAKMEELEPQAATKFAKFTADYCSATEICKREREIENILGWRLNPDTLYFWIEYYIRMWDQFVVLRKLNSHLSIKKKKLVSSEPPKGSLGLNEREFLSTASEKNH